MSKDIYFASALTAGSNSCHPVVGRGAQNSAAVIAEALAASRRAQFADRWRPRGRRVLGTPIRLVVAEVLRARRRQRFRRS